MSFTMPLNLVWACLVFAAIFLLYRQLEIRGQKYARAYTNLAFMESVVAVDTRWGPRIFAMLLSGVALLGIASAGPHLTLKLPLTDGTVIVCIDTSGSMASSDVEPTRAGAAVAALHRFVRELGPSVRVGIVSFSTGAQLVTAPTADREVLSDAIDTIPRPNGATAIGDALSLAAQNMPKGGRRAIILLTDGVNNRGSDPIEVSHDIAAQHIPIFTVGIGTSNSGQLIPGTDEEASSDPDALAQYAQITGGTATMAANSEAIISAFSGLAKSAIWEVQRIDASVIVALCGGICVTTAFLLGFGLGKLP